MFFQINVTANVGSTGNIAEEIGNMIIKHGFTSYIAYGRSKSKSNSQLISIGSYLSIYYHGFKTLFFDEHGLSSKHATIRLVKQMLYLKPRLVHLHNIHGYYLNYPILFEYLNQKNIPVVWTLHDCWPFTGHCAHFITFNCYKWKTQCEHCQYHSSYPRSLFYDNSKNSYILKRKYFASNNNVHLVSVSKWLDNFVSESFLSKLDRRVIYNGVNINIFKPTAINNSDKRFTILGVTNIWSKSKGLDDFICLSSLLDSNKYKIILVGLTAKQLKKMPSSINGVERTSSQEKLAEYYSVADVFVNMTYADTFPTTNLEALACGTPVITYNTGGSPEAVSEDTGFVVQQGDLDGVVRAIQTIEAKGKAYYSANCRKRAEENFDKDKQYEKYFELYEELLKDKKK
jgi:putative colanic acid biosynthesis glycosyltransferase